MANAELLEESLETFAFGVPAEGGGNYVSLQHKIAAAGYLMVSRHGQPDVEGASEVVSAMAGSEQIAEGLGLPQGTRVVLATSNLSSAVIAAVYGSEGREPLAPRASDDYGWTPSGEAPWVNALLEPNEPADTDDPHLSLGRVLLVDGVGFMPRHDMPGHFYKMDEGGLEAPEALDVSPREVMELAADGLARWSDRQTSHA